MLSCALGAVASLFVAWLVDERDTTFRLCPVVTAMAFDRQARADLRNALVNYMTGASRTYAFEDQYTACRQSADRSVQEISRALYYLHDGLIDHPISVTAQGWAWLRRVVAFLGTDLEIGPLPQKQFWPFPDEHEWQAHECLLDGLGLPDYAPTVHGRPANPWWNRIPTSIGIVVILLALIGMPLILSFCAWLTTLRF